MLHSGDRIHITAEHIEIERFFRVLGLFRNRARTVMIIGGSRLAYYLAKELISIKVRVKIIERDKARCEYLCEMLPEAVILDADGTDKEVLQEEGLEKTDGGVHSHRHGRGKHHCWALRQGNEGCESHCKDQ